MKTSPALRKKHRFKNISRCSDLRKVYQHRPDGILVYSNEPRDIPERKAKAKRSPRSRTIKENAMNQFYTAESVTEGHPDKLCDLIADSVLDESFPRRPLPCGLRSADGPPRGRSSWPERSPACLNRTSRRLLIRFPPKGRLRTIPVCRPMSHP